MWYPCYQYDSIRINSRCINDENIMNHQPKLILHTGLLCIGLYLALPAAASDGYGKRFDQGHLMPEISTSAPAELKWAAFMQGQWDITLIDHRSGVALERQAIADIYPMNRGHGYMEEIHAPQIAADDHSETSSSPPFDTTSILTFANSIGAWNYGEVDSLAEAVTLFHGYQIQNQLVLKHSERSNGGAVLSDYKLIIQPGTENTFSTELLISQDDGVRWKTVYKKSYRKREHDLDWFLSNHYGTPSVNRPVETAQFDFLIGEWDSNHAISLAPGQTAKFPVNSTAVHVMNGMAIKEFSWYNVDTNLPEAATTIIRIYNRAMRRWESLYVSNRGNTQLHFGGRQEGDEIVLHNFMIDSRAALIPNYVFHNIAQNDYSWYGKNTADKGQNWNTFWTIEFSRKQSEQ